MQGSLFDNVAATSNARPGTGERIVLPDAALEFFPAFFDSAESDRLLSRLMTDTPWRQDTIRFGGKPVPVPRLQAWYGHERAHYGYSGLALTPLPWTDTLSDIRCRLEASLGLSFNSVLLNLYRDGNDSVAWHSDDEPELGPDPLIASVSLGAARRFELRPAVPGKGGKRSLVLGHGSLLLMGSGLQRHWRHQLPKDPSISAPRLNLTFRLIR